MADGRGGLALRLRGNADRFIKSLKLSKMEQR